MSLPSKRSDRLVLTLLRAATATLGSLPPGLAVNAGAIAGSLARHLLPIRRKLVRENLERAFGSTHTPEERRRIESAAYRHLGMLAAECLGLWRHGPDWVKRQIVEMEGMDVLESFRERGEPFLVVTGHFGNWEMLGACFGARFRLSVLAKPLHNPLVDQELTAQRRRYGMEVLSSTESTVAREILRAVRAGRTVCFLADQDARRGGIFVPFFERPASTFTGPALMAVRLRIPLVPAFLMRLGPGRHRVVVKPPLQSPEGLSSEEAVSSLTIQHVKALEDMIRFAPSQYFWFHRRWKTAPRKRDRIRTATAL